MHCNWNYRRSLGGKEPAELKDWAHQLEISYFLARLLWHRGITSLKDMDVFLDPGLRHLPRLEEWPDLFEAAKLIASALGSGKKLAVWGDYDVDGITATALVVHFLRQRGYPVIPYLPDRLDQGYGLNLSGLQELKHKGFEILLTVDCGISDTLAIQGAKEMGMQVIVSDHHLPPDDLPQADVIIDPHLGKCSAYSNLAGVGVAFLLLAALNKTLPGPPLDMREYLDLVALGSIADVVNLTEENRILVKNGLLYLNEARRPGIFALKEVSGLQPTASMGSGQVAFSLAPRINAAGRLGDPNVALELLLAGDVDSARKLANQLERYNQERRKKEELALQEAMQQAEYLGDCPGLILYSPDWHQGVIGIVAARIVEQYYRPTLLLTKDGKGLKGSGRSIPEFDLFRGLSGCKDLLQGFGGHSLAAGVSLQEEALPDLRDSFNRAVVEQLGTSCVQPSLKLEAKFGLHMIDLKLVKELDLMQPFGPGNPQPIFSSGKLTVQRHNYFGKNNASLQLFDPRAKVSMSGKIWRQAHLLKPDIKGKNVRLAFTPRLNNYSGMTSIDLQIKDWQILESA